MNSPTVVRLFSSDNDRAYLLTRGDRVRLRMPALGPVRQEVSGAFASVLAEFRRSAQEFTGWQDYPILLDASSILGRAEGNTSKVQRLASPTHGRREQAVVIYLEHPRLPFDEYTVAHELTHNILYCEGLPRLEARQPRVDPVARHLLSVISTTTSHFLVHPRMAKHGFDVAARERERFKRFRPFLMGRPVSSAAILTCLDFFYHVPPETAAEDVPDLLKSFSTAAQGRFAVVRHIVEQARLPELRTIPVVAEARRLLLHESGLAGLATSVHPFGVAAAGE